eukprot:TRINITY_DN1822_c0_g1_i1.p1 TRINITY_DN1822_c0_g1~~TRINITY_DN1822_c0_g1_i1.p1  ORF type:complete len:292 (-),score=82.59 TRINITY_DN1822_c0_g1_i1:397-1272(-)
MEENVVQAIECFEYASHLEAERGHVVDAGMLLSELGSHLQSFQRFEDAAKAFWGAYEMYYKCSREGEEVISDEKRSEVLKDGEAADPKGKPNPPKKKSKASAADARRKSAEIRRTHSTPNFRLILGSLRDCIECQLRAKLYFEACETVERCIEWEKRALMEELQGEDIFDEGELLEMERVQPSHFTLVLLYLMLRLHEKAQRFLQSLAHLEDTPEFILCDLLFEASVRRDTATMIELRDDVCRLYGENALQLFEEVIHASVKTLSLEMDALWHEEDGHGGLQPRPSSPSAR